MFYILLVRAELERATIGGGKADVLRPRGAGDLAMAHLRLPSCLRPRARSGLNDMEEKNCAIDFCPRARGGYKRICILDRFKIVSVRLRGVGAARGACGNGYSTSLCPCRDLVFSGVRPDTSAPLPSARAGTWCSDHGSFQAAFVFPSACGGSSRPSSRAPVFVLHPLARSGAARGVCGNGYSTSLCPCRDLALCRYVLRRRFRLPARESAARAAGRKFRAKTHLPKVHDWARVSRVSEGRWRLNRSGVK